MFVFVCMQVQPTLCYIPDFLCLLLQFYPTKLDLHRKWRPEGLYCCLYNEIIKQIYQNSFFSGETKSQRDLPSAILNSAWDTGNPTQTFYNDVCEQMNFVRMCTCVLTKSANTNTRILHVTWSTPCVLLWVAFSQSEQL